MEQASISVEFPSPSADRDWSQLHADLLVRIFGTLDIPDLFSSGAVCRSWRLNHLETRRLQLCSQNQSPCLVYSSNDRDSNMATLHNLATDKLYHITLAEPTFRTRYVVGSSHGWLITADERSDLILINPATHAQLVMPSPGTIKNVRPRYSADGILDSYDILYMDMRSRDFDTETEPDDLTLEEGRFYFYLRVVLSCEPSSKNCVVVILHMYDYLLSYARVGDTEWTWIDTHSRCFDYRDILYNRSDGLFYAPRANSEVHSIDLNGHSPVIKVVLKEMISYIDNSKYIVRAPWGDFFQIWRYDKYLNKERVTEKFLVYKIDFVQQRIIETNSLQDHALFIGFNSAFLLPVKEFSMLIANSIYHTDDQMDYIFSRRLHPRQVIVFNMEENSFTDLVPLGSRLNWPPPVWFRPSLT